MREDPADTTARRLRGRLATADARFKAATGLTDRDLQLLSTYVLSLAGVLGGVASATAAGRLLFGALGVAAGCAFLYLLALDRPAGPAGW